MANLMDRQFNNSYSNNSYSIQDIILQARQNPKAFEEYVRTNNPQGYQQALDILKSPNPRDVVLQMANARGINPAIFRMLGIN